MPTKTLFVLWTLFSLTVTVRSQLLPDGINPFSQSADKQTATSLVPGLEGLPSTEEIEERQKTFRQRVGFPPEEGGQSPPETRRIRLIFGIDAAYEKQLETLQQLKETLTNLNADSPPVKWKMISSIESLSQETLTLDQLDQLHAIRKQLEERVELARQEVIRADRNLDLARQATTRAEESAPITGPEAQALSETLAALQQQNQELLRQARKEVFLLRQIQARLATKEEAYWKQRAQRFEPFFKSLLARVVVREENLETRLEEFRTRETELNQQLMIAQNAARKAEEAYQELETALPEDPDPVAAARLLSLLEKRNAARARVSLEQTRTAHLNQQEEILRHRHRFFQEELSRKDLVILESQTRPELQRLTSEKKFLENQRKQVEQEQKQLQLQRESIEGEGQTYRRQAIEAVQEHLKFIEQEILSTASTRAQTEIFLEELQTQTRRLDLKATQIKIGEVLAKAWQYELFRIEENRFTIGTLFWISIALLVAALISWGLARSLALFVFPRFQMGPGQTIALRKLCYYLFLVLSILIVFTAFGFPVSSLTVASGIIALAIGFGSQEIIKNFMSGLIMLIERPIHQGDIVELNDRILVVDSIGARSTRMRDYDSSEKIIPNSYLIENIITNRTLSDNIIRSTVEVGVAYGSPTRKVAELLREATSSVEGVSTTPRPFVIFTAFGDNALIFTVYFWCHADSRLSISSEVCHRIAEVLTEAGITIAFPQRDVHLDTLKPLQVQINEPDPLK